VVGAAEVAYEVGELAAAIAATTEVEHQAGTNGARLHRSA
jgi:hypothetical protein